MACQMLLFRRIVMHNAVVIVTYNRAKLLQECINHVLSQTIPFETIVVVDNHSTDSTEDLLHSYQSDPRFHIIREEENLGGAGGFWDGIRYLNHLENVPDYVLLIDDDAMIRQNYMQRIVQFASKNPRVEGFAGTVLVDGKIDTYHRRRIINRLLFQEELIPVDQYHTGKAFRCDCATFCGLVLRGKAMRQMGLPKKEYFLWYDDTEYTMRLMQKGGVAVVPSAVLDHKTVLLQETKSLLMRITWRQYYGYRNRYDTARLHLGQVSAWMVELQYRLFRFASRLMMLIPDDIHRTQGRYNVRMLSDVIRDERAGRLGKNSKYLPG